MQHIFVMPSEEHLSKVGGIGAIVGVVVLFVATMLHPLGAHPGDAPAAFAEYAMGETILCDARFRHASLYRSTSNRPIHSFASENALTLVLA